MALQILASKLDLYGGSLVGTVLLGLEIVSQVLQLKEIILSGKERMKDSHLQTSSWRALRSIFSRGP